MIDVEWLTSIDKNNAADAARSIEKQEIPRIVSFLSDKKEANKKSSE